MLMVADLSGVGWRICDGAGWRRHRPLYKYWVFSSNIRFRLKGIKCDAGRLISVLTVQRTICYNWLHDECERRQIVILCNIID